MSNLSTTTTTTTPKWGEPQADVGHWTAIAFPTLTNLARSLGPREGEEWNQTVNQIVLMQKSTGVLKVMFLKIKQLRLATHIQYK